MMEGAAMDTAMERAQAILADGPEELAQKERLMQVEETGRKIIEVLRTVHDPEIPVNIYELGLIYKIEIEDDDRVVVEMTLTSPNCPVAETMPGEVEQKVSSIDGVAGCEVKIVWDPPWNPSMMTEEAQLELGMIY
jgi:FeS assembly SUF system protein